MQPSLDQTSTRHNSSKGLAQLPWKGLDRGSGSFVGPGLDPDHTPSNDTFQAAPIPHFYTNQILDNRYTYKYYIHFTSSDKNSYGITRNQGRGPFFSEASEKKNDRGIFRMRSADPF